MFLQNARIDLQVCTVLQHRRMTSTSSKLCDPQISVQWYFAEVCENALTFIIRPTCFWVNVCPTLPSPVRCVPSVQELWVIHCVDLVIWTCQHYRKQLPQVYLSFVCMLFYILKFQFYELLMFIFNSLWLTVTSEARRVFSYGELSI